MSSFSESRPRHTLSKEDIPLWQRVLEQLKYDEGWIVSEHAYNNVRQGRVDAQAIEQLKNLDNWYVWALELGTENTGLRNPKPKLLVRYPSPDLDQWQLGGAVAVGAPLLIVTIFPNYNLMSR